MVKKPAHEVVLELLKEKVSVLNEDFNQMILGGILALVQVLERMTIPEKHIDEVVNCLRQIKASYFPKEEAETLFPERLFSVVSSAKKNAIVEFVAQGKDFTSSEGIRLLLHSERSAIKDAARNPEVAKALMSGRDRSVNPYFRRKILLALSD